MGGAKGKCRSRIVIFSLFLLFNFINSISFAQGWKTRYTNPLDAANHPGANLLGKTVEGGDVQTFKSTGSSTSPRIAKTDPGIDLPVNTQLKSSSNSQLKSSSENPSEAGTPEPIASLPPDTSKYFKRSSSDDSSGKGTQEGLMPLEVAAPTPPPNPRMTGIDPKRCGEIHESHHDTYDRNMCNNTRNGAMGRYIDYTCDISGFELPAPPPKDGGPAEEPKMYCDKVCGWVCVSCRPGATVCAN
jgi:hypothetical protein